MNKMWINQPSPSQKHHKLHGLLVHAETTDAETTVKIWFVVGPLRSMQIESSALSPGWLTEKIGYLQP